MTPNVGHDRNPSTLRLESLETAVPTVRIASSLDTQSDSKQISMLLYYMGEEAEMVLSSTNISESERESYDDVLGKLDEYFHVRQRARFNRRD